MGEKIYQDYSKCVNSIYNRMLKAINEKHCRQSRQTLASDITRFWAEELWVRLLKAENETAQAEAVATDKRWNDRELVWHAYEAKKFGGIENQPIEVLIKLFETPVPELNEIIEITETDRTIALGNYSLADSGRLAMEAAR